MGCARGIFIFNFFYFFCTPHGAFFGFKKQERKKREKQKFAWIARIASVSGGCSWAGNGLGMHPPALGTLGTQVNPDFRLFHPNFSPLR